MVAPNSPSARAQHSTAPAAMPGATSGRVTRRNVVHRSAPRVAAASSKRASAARSAPSTLMTRNGIATKVSAMTTAVVVNGTVTPRAWSSQRPTMPCRPSTRKSATPPTTGGSTSGTVTRARSTDRPRARERASTQASGTPRTRESPVAAVAETRLSRSACPTAGLVSCGPSSPQGARMTRPASGRTRKATARTAGTSSGTGTPGSRPRLTVPTVRSRAALRSSLAGARCDAHAAVRSRRAEAGVRERLLPLLRAHQLDEGGGRLGVRGVGQRRDRVVVDRLLGLRDVDALDGVPGRGDVGRVDQRGVDLAELDLGQRGAHVLLERVGGGRDAGGGEDVLGGGAAGHLGRADGDRQVLAREVGQAGDAGRLARGDGELQYVGGEDLRVVGRAGVGDDGHLRLVGAGEDVGGGALGELRGQRGAAGEIELDVQTGVVGLELFPEVGEDVGERGGGEDGEGAAELGGARSRCRGRAVVRRPATAGEQEHECGDDRGTPGHGTSLRRTTVVRACGTITAEDAQMRLPEQAALRCCGRVRGRRR